MGPADAIKTCLAKSFQVKGRASRSEFWWPTFSLCGLAVLLFFLIEDAAYRDVSDALVATAFIFPALAITVLLTLGVRRMHDIEVHGLCWSILAFIGSLPFQLMYLSNLPIESYGLILLIFLNPIITIVSCILAALPSDTGTNKYGPNPHEVPS